jgi:hypothetical protein
MADPKRIGLSGQARGIDPQRQRRNSLTTDETIAAPLTLNERGQITLALTGPFTLDKEGALVLNIAPPLTVTNNSPLTLSLQTDTTLKTANGKLTTNISTATPRAPGLMPALDGDTSKFLSGDGVYRAPSYPLPRLDECAPPTDTTNLDSSTTAHGLLPKLSGVATEVLLGDGTWATPPGPSGTVTSVSLSAPTGLIVSGSPVTSSGSLDLTFDVGYSIPTTSSQANWDSAYAATSSLGNSANLNVGTTAGTVAAGDDSRFVTDLGYTAATRDLTSSTGTAVNLPLFTDTEDGLTPASGGGTTNFLRADGTWAAPGGGGGSGLDQPAVMARMAFGGF